MIKCSLLTGTDQVRFESMPHPIVAAAPGCLQHNSRINVVDFNKNRQHFMLQQAQFNAKLKHIRDKINIYVKVQVVCVIITHTPRVQRPGTAMKDAGGWPQGAARVFGLWGSKNSSCPTSFSRSTGAMRDQSKRGRKYWANFPCEPAVDTAGYAL